MPMTRGESPRTAARPVLAVSGETLVAAAWTRLPDGPHRSDGPARRRPAGPYRRLFAEAPGSTAFTVGSVLSRLPMGMFGVSVVIMIASTRGSYALAGAVTAVGLAATAVAAPWVARLVDRYGQARVAVPATVWSTFAGIALLVCVHLDAPAWTLFAAYAARSTTPNTGGMARARWAHVHRSDQAALHIANSFEQAADEACFMLGPVLAAFLCTALFPEAGLLVATLLLLGGVLVFAAQRATEPPVAAAAPGRAGSPLRARGTPALLAVFACTGVIFGAMEVTTVAFADAQGHPAAAGPVLALQATGSCVAGLLYGLARPTGPAARRFVIGVGAMALLMTLPLLAGSVPALAVCLFLAGCATAPTMVGGMTLVQSLVPPARLNEGLTLAVTAILSGIAGGSALAGSVAERFPPGTGYWLPPTAGAAALLCALRLRATGPADRPTA